MARVRSGRDEWQYHQRHVTCVTPSPRFAYVANFNDASVSIYTVNATSGQLRFNGYIGAGTKPISVAVDPLGKFVYVANNGDSI